VKNVLLAAAALVTSCGLAASAIPERQFELSYGFTVHVPPGARSVRIWAPVAVSDENQTVSSPEISSPVAMRRTHESEYENEMLYSEVRPEGQAKDIPVEIRYRVARRESSGENGSGPPAPRFLRADRLVPIGGKMKTLAETNTKGLSSPVEKARALYDYVFRNLRYDKSGTGWGRGDSLWACDAKHGNCTDFHSLFISMARAEAIPARFEIGFPLPPGSRSGAIPGYHCWAEFYAADRGWVPVDISEAWQDPARREFLFGHLDPNRVAFATGRDLTLEPPQDGPPLNYFIYPYVEVDGKPFDGVTRKFSFRDVPAESASN